MNAIINSFGFFPHQPSLFTADITGFLKQNNVKVKNIDINLLVWEYIMSEEYISQLKFRPEVFNDSPFLLAPKISQQQYVVLKKSVLEELDAAKAIYRSKDDFYNIKKLNWATYVQIKIQQLVYYHYGTFITNKFVAWHKIAFNIKSLENIYDLSQNRTYNPLIDIYEKVIIPILIEMSPKVIGVEMMFPWEIIGVLSLNMLIKSYLPKTHITYLGHGFDEVNFCRIQDKMKENIDFFFKFDSVFMVRNNESILRLFQIDNLGIEYIKSLPSLAVYDVNQLVTINPPLYERSVNFDILPDYSDIDLSRYFSPDLVLYDKISNKCFWSQCAFCSINVYKKNQQLADVDKYVERIVDYKNMYNCSHIWFIDEATPPHIIEKFVNALECKEIKVVWSVRTRIDDKLNYDLLEKMYKAGCRELWIGLESVSPRMLELMNKTDNPDEYSKIALRITKDCSLLGIGLHYCTLLGFPTEKDEDREMLLSFFRKCGKYFNKILMCVTFNEFMLMKDSPMYFNYRHYGIKKIVENDGNYDMVNIPFELDEGDNDSGNLINVYKTKTEKVTFKIVNALVSNKILLVLWFYVTDTCQELLLKSRYGNKNPFRKKTSIKDAILLLLTLKMGKSRFLFRLVIWLQRKYAGVNI